MRSSFLRRCRWGCQDVLSSRSAGHRGFAMEARMSPPAAVQEDAIDAAVLLGVLAQVKGGDFSARMPLAWTGVAGKVADGFNEVIIANQVLGAELARVSQVVGKEGK